MSARILAAVFFLGVAFLGYLGKPASEDPAIREHRFHLGMSAADLEKSLGQPTFKQADGRAVLWVYPSVAIKLGDGYVIDSVKLPTSAQ